MTVRDFEGLTAVVTGAGSGIGLATATLLHARGAKVFGLDLNEGEMELKGVAAWIKCDVSDAPAVEKAVAEVSKKSSTIDVLVNNAAIGSIGTIETEPDTNWEKIFNINVFGLARVSRAALPSMRKSKSASIVNVCSIAATAGLPNRAIYSASKGAVLSLSSAMACDLLKDKIRVNCVNPGTADTPWVQRLLAQAQDPVAERARLEERQPFGRLITAEEIASSIVFLASPMQSGITGTALAVDGGMQGLRVSK